MEHTAARPVTAGIPPVTWQEAIALVRNYPGCTVSELLAHTEAAETAPAVQQGARIALLNQLHQAARHGHLVPGPERSCRVRNVRLKTWEPTENLALQALPVTGLRFLETLVARAITELRAVA